VTGQIRNFTIIVALAALALAGCKKHVAANTPAPTPAPAPPAAPKPTITLRATPGALDSGQSATLQWDAKNATSVQIQPAVGTVTNTGTRSINPTSSVTYTATATGPGGTASDSTRITVRVPAPPAARTEPRPAPTVNLADLFKQNIQVVFFDYDKADIRPDQVSRLQTDAAWLKSHPAVKFIVEGYADDRGSEEYNLGLGDRRANTVKEFPIKQGVPQSAITTISYGEERPICHEETEDCYSKNRRAAFIPGS